MPEFKNKEEYEKWKTEKVKAGKENQDKAPQEIPVRTTNVKQSSEIKKAIVWTLATIVLLAVGYFGYQYYAGHKQKKDLRIIIQKFKELGSALSVGLNEHDYNERLINIKIEMDKFNDAHKYSIFSKHDDTNKIMELLEKAFQAYNDGKSSWGDNFIELTYGGKYSHWAEKMVEKYPLLQDKIMVKIPLSAYGTGTLKEGDTVDVRIYRTDFKDIVWSYAADYIKDAESLL